jgi:hypothetical protein
MTRNTRGGKPYKSLQEFLGGNELTLRTQGGDSRNLQADATPPGVELPGLFATAHYCTALATLPLIAQRFWQPLLHEYGPAQVGFDRCFH